MAFQHHLHQAYSDPSLKRLKRHTSRSISKIKHQPFYTADVDDEYDSDNSEGTCVVSKINDNSVLGDMASFLKQKMVIGSLWECRAFTAEGPDSIMFLTFSLTGGRALGEYEREPCEESTMW